MFDDEKLDKTLDTVWHSLDLERVSVREYLRALLAQLLDKEECFSGKRPFGNSGWQGDLATPLVASGLIEGELDEDGYASDYDRAKVGDALVALSDRVFWTSRFDHPRV